MGWDWQSPIRAVERYLLPLLLVACVLSLGAACFLGTTAMDPGRVAAALLGLGPAGDGVIVWQIRLPRALAAFAVGAALGASGAALQGLLRNPLAEPGVLGVSATASLMATLSIYYGLTQLSAWILPLSAITGALGATLGLTLIALKAPSIVTLILIGVGISSFSGAAMSLVMNFAPHPFTLSDMVNWMLGTVAHRSLNDIAMAAPFLGAGFFMLMTHRRGLSALTLGEEAAQGLGVDLQKQRIAIVLGAGLLTGAAVSIAGVIGFVGIVAPHLVRPLVRYDPARVLFPAALLAGIILVISDIFIRLLPTNTELKLGVIAALIGAPAFILIAAQQRASYE